MKIEENCDLSKFTHLRIGGFARRVYYLEEVIDLEKLPKDLFKTVDINILGKGSNILINDKKTFPLVISMKKFEKRLEMDSRGRLLASSSISIQSLLRYANKHNKGGAEYLYSLPANVGGIVAMNAGRGNVYKQSISDYVEKVTIFDGEKICDLDREACEFSYRNSIFLRRKFLILYVTFNFDFLPEEDGRKRMEERIEFSKKEQNTKKPNAGSVFKESNSMVMEIVRRSSLGWRNGCQFSSKTANWINNNGKGTFRQAILLINIVKALHLFLFKKKPVIEWQIWK